MPARYLPRVETVHHGFDIVRHLSAELRLVSAFKSKALGKNVSMAKIVNDALEEYFINHKEELKQEFTEYQNNGGFLTMEEAKFLK